MAAQGLSRKRPAPGTSPLMYQNPVQPNSNGFSGPLGPQLSDDQFLQWGQNAQSTNTYGNSQAYNQPAESYGIKVNQTSNQLARRPLNQLASRARPQNDQGAQIWADPTSAVENRQADGAWGDDVDELEQKAQIAKKEAQGKRKQIPPFVQKLSSFLDDGKNNDLIRWSDDGNSFIVIDEDEFARTLIPELFKHNNYASFVRQLNMYGFHKKVGLSDNSMRASERKNKSPSEYSNSYFRRGHPDLLWLIQKPKNVTGQPAKAKNKTKADGDQNDDDGVEYIEEIPNSSDGRPTHRPQLAIGQGEATLSQEQFASVQRELQAIRAQQNQIAKMMASLKQEHQQLYGQAATFQDQHTRHENSINAILTFLATVYNRSLQGHDGTPGISNLFAGSIPHDTSPGNVVDVGDYSFDHLNGAESGMSKPFKRQQLLLQAPPSDQPSARSSALSPGSSVGPSQGRQTRRMAQAIQQSDTRSPRTVEELFDSNNPTPTQPSQSPAAADGYPQRDIMSVIQSTNARHSVPGTPAAEFSNVLTSLENSGGNTPLTSSQRADMLRLINNSAQQPGDNALISPTPPAMSNNYDRQLASTKADLDNLAKLQAEQDRSVQNLTNLLVPLSPSGSIPGIGDGTSLPPPPLDIDDFLSHNDYFTDFPPENNDSFNFGGETDGSGINFANLDGDEELFSNIGNSNQQNGSDQYNVPTGEEDGGGRVESVTGSSEVTTPGNTAENDGMTTRCQARRSSESGRSSTKRRRKNP